VTIAGSATLDLRPAANVARAVSIGCASSAGNNFIVQLWDGTNSCNLLTLASAAGGGISFPATDSAVGARIQNTSGSVTTYCWVVNDRIT